MDLTLLKKLCLAHAVTGDTSEIKNLLKSQLTANKINYEEEGYGTIVFGNLSHPQKLVASHIDEVGFQITKIEDDGKIRILPVGWVFANRLDHAIVYVSTPKGKVPGVVLHEHELKTENITGFNLLYLDVGVDSKKEVENIGIKPGQTGSFQKEFIENHSSVIASSLDNKISQFVVFQILEKHPEFLEQNMFAFITDEEMQDQSANGICHKYQPDFALVLDYCPIHQKLGTAESLGKSGHGPFVMYRGGSHILHEKVRNFFEEKIKLKFQRGFLSSETIQQLEPFNFQNNSHSKAVNICIPAFGYHGAAYTIRKKDIADFCEFLEEVLQKPF